MVYTAEGGASSNDSKFAPMPCSRGNVFNLLFSYKFVIIILLYIYSSPCRRVKEVILVIDDELGAVPSLIN